MKKIQEPVFSINVIGPSDDSNEFSIGAIDGKAAIELGEHVMKETESGFSFDGDVSIKGKIDLGSSTELATTKDLEGKQDKIDSSNELSSDLVDDTGKVHLFVSSAEKETWNGKSAVSANPSGSDGDDLTRISINGTNYKIPSGGGGGSSPKALTTILDMFDVNLSAISGRTADDNIYINLYVNNVINILNTYASEAVDGNWVYVYIGLFVNEDDAIDSVLQFGASKEDGEWNIMENPYVEQMRLFGIHDEGYDLLSKNLYNALMVEISEDSVPSHSGVIYPIESDTLSLSYSFSE